MPTKREWYVVTIATQLQRAPELVEQIRERWSIEPAEITKPGSELCWLEIYFEEPEQAHAVHRELAGASGVVEVDMRPLRPRDWSTFWRRHVRPLSIGHRLWIVPRWDGRARAGRRLTVRLDPGMGFGTGDHFTTRFCLETLDSLCARCVPKSLLDAGCGSGIVAIAAAKLGVPRVVAVDHDPWAVAETDRNARLNRVRRRLDVICADLREWQSHGVFEVVCANLYAPLLQQLAEPLSRWTRRTLILSGIREEEADRTVAPYLARGFREVERDGDGVWCGARLER